MSSANPAPAVPPAVPPSVPPPGPQQPRWAWWVVGIVIPLVGLLVAVLLRGSDSPGGTPRESPFSGTRSSASAGSIDQEALVDSPTRSAEAVQAPHVPDVVEADMTYGSHLELDTSEPVVSRSAIKGADVLFVALLGGPVLAVPGSASTLAPLPASDAAPTAEECADSVERNGTSTVDVKRDDGFCLLTDEGNVAYLRVLTAPNSGTGKLDVTVWDTPGA